MNEFFVQMGEMGAEIFNLSWIETIISFINKFAWAMFTVGLVIAVFDTALEYQGGRGSIKDTFLNILKGFMATSLFTVLPIELYKFSVSLQSSFGNDIIRSFGEADTSLTGIAQHSLAITMNFDMIFSLFAVFAFGYCIIKVFLANIKRGGILIITISVGAFYMFSVPRGYIDGFVAWCKQVIALCLTAFLQTTLLVAGLLTFREHILLGLGIMISATEVPRIAGQFGLDTSTKTNLMSAIYSARSLAQMTSQVVSKIKG